MGINFYNSYCEDRRKNIFTGKRKNSEYRRMHTIIPEMAGKKGYSI